MSADISMQDFDIWKSPLRIEFLKYLNQTRVLVGELTYNVGTAEATMLTNATEVCTQPDNMHDQSVMKIAVNN